MNPLARTRYPGVYRRGGRYAYVWRDRNGKQRWGSAATLEGARRAKATKEAAVARGEFEPTTTVLLGDYMLEQVEHHRGTDGRGFDDATRTTYLLQIHRWVLEPRGYFAPATPLATIDAPTAVQFVRWLARQRSDRTHDYLAPSTIRDILKPLRLTFTSARFEGHIQSNPFDGVPIPSKVEAPFETLDEDEEGLRKALSRDELVALLNLTPDDYELAVRTLACTGLRWSELTGLDGRHLIVSDTDARLRLRQGWRRGRLRKLKTRFSRRDVPVPLPLAHELVALRRAQRQPLFQLNGRRLDYHAARSAVMLPAREALGLPWLGFHSLRHTCASMLFQRGYSLPQVQRWLGHHSAAFTLRTYVHLLPDDLPAAFDPLAAPDRASMPPVVAHTLQGRPLAV